MKKNFYLKDPNREIEELYANSNVIARRRDLANSSEYEKIIDFNNYNKEYKFSSKDRTTPYKLAVLKKNTILRISIPEKKSVFYYKKACKFEYNEIEKKLSIYFDHNDNNHAIVFEFEIKGKPEWSEMTNNTCKFTTTNK